jgi:hypothetical protein
LGGIGGIARGSEKFGGSCLLELKSAIEAFASWAVSVLVNQLPTKLGGALFYWLKVGKVAAV